MRNNEYKDGCQVFSAGKFYDGRPNYSSTIIPSKTVELLFNLGDKAGENSQEEMSWLP